MLVQWDGFWYLNIVNHGYTFFAHRESSMAFFPLYPIVVKTLSYVMPLQPTGQYAALIVSNCCLLVACFLFYSLITVDYADPRIARFAVAFLLFSPVSFFFSAAYAESLFLMLMIGSVLAAVKQRWLVASLLGMGAAATRQVGVLLLAPLLVEYVHQARGASGVDRRVIRKNVAWLALVPIGVIAFFMYAYLRFNDFFAWFKASKAFGRHFTSPIETFSNMDSKLLYTWLFVGTTIVAVLLIAAGGRLRIRASYSVLAIVLLAVPLCSGMAAAIPRYVSAVFPLYLVAAILASRHRWSYEPMLAGSAALLGLFTVVFATGYWFI